MINWEAGGTKWKVIAAVGIAAMAVLALIVLGAYYPNPASNALINALRLTRTQVVTKTVYVNNTVVRYVNQTVVRYVNQTVPVYINRTVYVYVNGTGPLANALMPYYCEGEIWILNNGTVWLAATLLLEKDLLPMTNSTMQWIMTYYNSTAGLAWYSPNAAFIIPGGIFNLIYLINYTVLGQYYPAQILEVPPPLSNYTVTVVGDYVILNSTLYQSSVTLPLNATVTLPLILYGTNYPVLFCRFYVSGPWAPQQAYYQEIPLIQYYCLGINATEGPVCHTYIGHYMELMSS